MWIQCWLFHPLACQAVRLHADTVFLPENFSPDMNIPFSSKCLNLFPLQIASDVWQYYCTGQKWRLIWSQRWSHLDITIATKCPKYSLKSLEGLFLPCGITISNRGGRHSVCCPWLVLMDWPIRPAAIPLPLSNKIEPQSRQYGSSGMKSPNPAPWWNSN